MLFCVITRIFYNFVADFALRNVTGQITRRHIATNNYKNGNATTKGVETT